MGGQKIKAKKCTAQKSWRNQRQQTLSNHTIHLIIKTEHPPTIHERPPTGSMLRLNAGMCFHSSKQLCGKLSPAGPSPSRYTVKTLKASQGSKGKTLSQTQNKVCMQIGVCRYSYFTDECSKVQGSEDLARSDAEKQG